jgi:hypothetical protein
MEFDSREKWWPDKGMRPTRHEGVDICYYEDEDGTEGRLSSATYVPVMALGRIVAICRDFLGYSLFLDHEYDQPLRFCSVYAHIRPKENLAVGQLLNAADVIGTIADTKGRKNRMPAHLHLSLMRLDGKISPDTFNWNLITTSPQVELLDPLPMIASGKIHFPERNHWKEMRS